MTLQSFIESHDVDFSKNLIQESEVNEFERAAQVNVGKQLGQYILKYGYLAYDYIELYGINSKQLLNSDMVKQTIYLHKYYPKTKGLIAIENQGEGDYFCTDSNDMMFEFDSELDKLTPIKLKLFDYILSRFQSVT